MGLDCNSFFTVSALSPTLAIAASISSFDFPKYLHQWRVKPLVERSTRLRSSFGGGEVFNIELCFLTLLSQLSSVPPFKQKRAGFDAQPFTGRPRGLGGVQAAADTMRGQKTCSILVAVSSFLAQSEARHSRANKKPRPVCPKAEALARRKTRNAASGWLIWVTKEIVNEP